MYFGQTDSCAGSPPPDESADQSLRRLVTVSNPQGLHIRPLAAFAKAASGFRSAVTVCRDDRRVNGKSLMDLLLLQAGPGAELLLEVSGEDASVALDTLVEILAAVYDELTDTAEPRSLG